ncbi:MAG: hypothetical protein V3V82_08080 [Acidimicrobiia bacterium]
MAVRSLIRRPFYSGVAITILTLGLAASSTVVTYINSFFRPFPGINADRLVQIYGVERDNPYASISYLDYVDYAAAAKGSFEGLAATQMSFAGGLRHGTTSDQVFGQAVSGNYFWLLGVGMALGRETAAIVAGGFGAVNSMRDPWVGNGTTLVSGSWHGSVGA